MCVCFIYDFFKEMFFLEVLLDICLLLIKDLEY